MENDNIEKILDKLEIIQLRLDKVELQQKELLNKFGAHIDFINETYEGLKSPLNAAKRFLGKK
jgi:Trp operon repressor